MTITENRDDVAALVRLADTQTRAVRINITLPQDVLDAIDRYAAANGLTRSGFLGLAPKKIIERAA